MTLRAPFPWFGGKSRAASLIWDRLGNVPNYVEPFAGSLAVLLMRPHEAKVETVNDRDAYLSNFWRAIHADPQAVATHADWPVSEPDLHARHAWLVAQSGFRDRMLSDPDYFDAKIAGWWVWGIAQWIGTGWCAPRESTPSRKMPNVSSHSPLVRQLPTNAGRMPSLGNGGRGINKDLDATGHPHAVSACDVYEWFASLSTRLRRVRVCCGDWTRVLGPSVLSFDGGRPCGVLLDPPYEDNEDAYSVTSKGVASAVRDWALEHGDDPNLRIALCGYEGEHEMPGSWERVAWSARGGYSHGRNGNQRRERIWFSPHCLRAQQASLFGGAA